MISDKPRKEPEKKFEPLEIMGIFWLVFGVVVLISTFFVKGTSLVPLIRGVVTNIIAGLLLLAAGLFSILKGRANKRREKL
ncbi:MAG: hypothetical protein JSV96_14775 [Candidatus Aminicenantes bacterium]|nr:MAG: hypothetical protein JSV96_14775 [Candidatus Aminicenantes bacterium]